VPTPKKEATVAELSDMLSRATMTVVADYRGLKVSEMQTFRTTLRGLNADAKVTKNTLATIASFFGVGTLLTPSHASPGQPCADAPAPDR
jgi:hypothetical protein